MQRIIVQSDHPRSRTAPFENKGVIDAVGDASRTGYGGAEVRSWIAIPVKVYSPDHPAEIHEQGMYDGGRGRGGDSNGMPAKQPHAVKEGAMIGTSRERLLWLDDGEEGAGFGMSTLEYRRKG